MAYVEDHPVGIAVESEQQFNAKEFSDPDLYWDVAMRRVPQDGVIHVSGSGSRVYDKATGSAVGYEAHIKLTMALPLPRLHLKR